VFYLNEVMLMIVKSKLTWACVLGCAGMVGSGTAMAASEIEPTENNPYSVISDRNIFHLNPPPIVHDDAEDKPPVELPKVMLTAFVGKGSSIRVLMAIPPKDSKDSIAYLNLAPGDRDHNVQVVKIRLDKEEVDIINSGTAQTLSGKSNSYAALAATAPPGGGGGGGFREKGGPGMHRAMIPGFAPPPPAGGPSAGPSAGNTTRGGGGSSLIVGGGAESGSQYGGSSSGAIVSGGSSYNPSVGGVPGQYARTDLSPTGNAVNGSTGVGSQLANSLFNPQSGHFQPPAPVNPLPIANQAAGLVLGSASGGPPMPPSVQEAVDNLNGQEPGGGAPPPGTPNE
jgi:hypothetical protein